MTDMKKTPRVGGFNFLEPGKFFNMLHDLELKKHPKKNLETLFWGDILHIVDPWEFYILPKYSSWHSFMQNDKESVSKLVMPQLMSLVQNMTKYYETLFIPLETYQWKINQLVAVGNLSLRKLIGKSDGNNITEGEKSFYRGVIVGSLPGTGDEKVMLKVFFIDVGVTQCFPISELATLETFFMELPPLVYNCRLFGVSPVGSHWSGHAIEVFQKIALGQECIVNIMSMKLDPGGEMYSSKRAGDNNILFNEEQYYVVDLRKRQEVESESATDKATICYERIADELASQHLALAWNYFPKRPSIITTMSSSNAVVIFDPNVFKNSSSIQAVEDREIQRLTQKMELQSADISDQQDPPVLVFHEKIPKIFGDMTECNGRQCNEGSTVEESVP